MLMEAQRITVQNSQGRAADTNVLHDSVSSITLCRHEWANKLGLKYQDYQKELQVVKQPVEHIYTFTYEGRIRRRDNNMLEKIMAVSLDSINYLTNLGDISELKELFRQAP